MTRAGIGFSVPRKESFDKVTGQAMYSDDFSDIGILHIKLLTSPYGHAKILRININEALQVEGVKVILTGNSPSVVNITTGPLLEDRPPLAKNKVRYYGEPIALVVADTEDHAKAAVQKINVEYELLPVINSATDAIKENAVLVHENNAQYKFEKDDVKPIAGTNIMAEYKIRKGNIQQAWSNSKVIIESNFKLPQSDHVATETRSAKCQIKPDGRVEIYSTTQGPAAIKKIISKYFHVELGKVIVHAPLVGGGFGGKTPAQLEVLAYLASQAVDGRLVKIANTREEDMVMSPCHLGMEGKVKLGATQDGKIIAAEYYFLVDGGAYSETGPKMAKAATVDCTGPYNIENVWCDTFCVYTNHTYTTAFRGFGHLSATFAMERALDKLALELKMDPVDLRLKNAIMPGNYNPTGVKVTPSFFGDISQCIHKVRQMINWEEGQRIILPNGKIKSKGFSNLWKTSSSPPNAVSGVVLLMNSDGTINVNCGIVEYGHGTKTTVAQILAEKMKMDVSQIHVQMEVNTLNSPDHWKTVASMSTFMLGRAVLEAADELSKKILSIAAIAFRCPVEALDMSEGKVYFKADSSKYMEYKDLVHGYQYPNGDSIGGQIMATGEFIMSNITKTDPQTGQGKTGPYWTVGAQAVEVEYDPKDHSYRILRAASCIDAGKVLNPKNARAVVMGGMCMGLGYGSREEFIYDEYGRVINIPLRSYKIIRFGEEPKYLVDFVETPNELGPFGARGFGEHGILGMPAALANALSSAAEADLSQCPITPEAIWRMKVGQA